jgi:excisionase family DNA binding protein
MTRLLNIDELADYLRLQRQTIYNWLHQGKISGIKVGGVWRFEKKEIDAWLRDRRQLPKDLKFKEKQP